MWPFLVHRLVHRLAHRLVHRLVHLVWVYDVMSLVSKAIFLRQTHDIDNNLRK